MAYKTTRKKTGVNSYEKRTYNTKTGSTRITRTVKPTKSLTISRSVNKNGSVKTTTTNNINGWVTKTSKTSGSTPRSKSYKPKRTKSVKSYSSRSGRGGDLSLSAGGIFVIVLCIIIMAYFPTTVPYLIMFGGIIGAIWIFWMLLPWLVWGSIIIGVVYLISLFT